ncbi:MAG: B12-binding domain-containing radical SAM protein, partial [Candidatus Aureabacteria bacterium]|nr:B12-binding domain-containing radical SAM protein [Candidatus Auribacterota bacterium]
IWKSSFDETGIDMSSLSCKPGDKLPWSHIDYGVKQGFLITERQKALKGEMTPDCRISKECTGCGACD